MDCRRTDRTQPLFASTTPTIDPVDDEKGMHMRYSTISPGLSDIGAQAPTNEHIERMASILLTYNFYDTDLGASFPGAALGQHDAYGRRVQATCRGCPTSALLCTSSPMRTRR